MKFLQGFALMGIPAGREDSMVIRGGNPIYHRLVSFSQEFRSNVIFIVLGRGKLAWKDLHTIGIFQQSQ